MHKSLWEEIIQGVNGARICLGIDPHLSILENWIEEMPQAFIGLDTLINEEASSDDNYGPTKDFSKLTVREKLLNPVYAGCAVAIFSSLVIDSIDESNVVAIKPQSAFFEQFGSEGIRALESLIRVARMREIPVILDVKRGDIGSTMIGYANAYLSDEHTLSVDAITVSPFLGLETVKEIADIANENHRGIFLLCLTSNEDAKKFQLAKTDSNRTIAKEIFDFAKNYNDENGPTIGLVVGATIEDAAKIAGIDFSNFNAPILCPGVGAQGGNGDNICEIFGDAINLVLPSISREILNSGPELDKLNATTTKCVEDLYEKIEKSSND